MVVEKHDRTGCALKVLSFGRDSAGRQSKPHDDMVENLSAQPNTAFGATPFQDLTTSCGFHTRPKSVIALASYIAGLKCSFHSRYQICIYRFVKR